MYTGFSKQLSGNAICHVYCMHILFCEWIQRQMGEDTQFLRMTVRTDEVTLRLKCFSEPV
jgi:hypothetical protein